MARLDALDAKRPERSPAARPARRRTARRWPARWPRARSWSCAPPDRAGGGPLCNGRVAAIFPRLSSLADRITIEPAMQDEPRYLREAMAPHGVRPR